MGTDPATGNVYGINAKILTKWTGTGNATTVGTITGDVTWTTGTTLNDIAMDAGGNLYCIVFLGTNTHLYRISPTALTAKLVVTATGTHITDGVTTNGNGLAYLGDYFYYSRINGANTDIWKLAACQGGVSSYVGSVVGLNLGDLGSCATVTCVPADFSFNCLVPGGGLQEGNFAATGASQTNILRVPLTSTITGLVNFTVTGTGITASPTPYTVTLEQGVTYADIPVTFDGSGAAGTRTITVTADVTTGSCSMTVTVDPCLAGTTAPTLSGTTANNVCPAATANLNSLVTSTTPTGASLVWFTNSAHSGTAYGTPTTATANTYYAFYYDSAIDCYSPATGAVTAVIAVCCPTTTNITGNNVNPTTCGGTNGSIKICGLTANGTGYTVNYDKNTNPATPLTNQTADASGCITITGLGAGAYTNILVSSTGCPAGTNALSASLTDPSVSTAPTLSGTAISNTCPAATANLNSLVTSTLPSGATLEWFTNNAHTGTAYGTPTTAVAGTYYAFYKSSGTCYSAATSGVTVTINSCCNAGSTAPALIKN